GRAARRHPPRGGAGAAGAPSRARHGPRGGAQRGEAPPPRRRRRALRGPGPPPGARDAERGAGRGRARARVSLRSARPRPDPASTDRRRPRRGIPVLLRGELRPAARGGRGPRRLQPARRPDATSGGRALPRRRLPRAPCAAARRERRHAPGGAPLRGLGAADLRRVRRSHVPRGEPRGRGRRRSRDGRRAAGAGADVPATHGARLHGGRVHRRDAARAVGRHRARPRVPLLERRPRAGGRGARLPDHAARSRAPRRGLPGRPDAHELRPPPLRLEPGARALARRRVCPRMRTALLALGLLLALRAPAAALTTRDMLGRPVTLAAPATRIVSLVPSVTEILFALGADNRLVGVTDFCDYPAAARQKPSVGGMVSPNLEVLVSRKPDLVVATTEGTREETVAQLERLRIPTYLVVAHRVTDVTALVSHLGELTGRRVAADALRARIEQRVDAVRRAVAPYRRPRVLYVL